MAQKRRHPLEKTRRWYPFEAHPPHLSLSVLSGFFLFFFLLFCFFSFCFALRLDFCFLVFLVFFGLCRWPGSVVWTWCASLTSPLLLAASSLDIVLLWLYSICKDLAFSLHPFWIFV